MRLKEQLSKVQGADLDAMAALQNDRYSVAADILLAGLEEAIKKGRGRTPSCRGRRRSSNSSSGIGSSTTVRWCRAPGLRAGGVAAHVRR